jgi:hypothetical protein
MEFGRSLEDRSDVVFAQSMVLDVEKSHAAADVGYFVCKFAPRRRIA